MDRRKKGIPLLLLVTNISFGAFAADSPPADTAAGSRSVYEINPWVDGSVLGVAALGAAVPLFFEDELIKKNEFLKREDINRFDRSATQFHNKDIGLVSHFVVATTLVTPVVVDCMDVGWTKTYLEDMVVFTQALAVQSAIANVARFSAKRPRPDAYSKPQPISAPQEYESFYSGHTASTFAGLTVMSLTYTYRYGPSPWPWVITAGVGATQGTLRILAGRHFYTDTLVGMGVGLAVGTAVPMLHRRAKGSDWSLVPTAGPDDVGLVYTKKF